MGARSLSGGEFERGVGCESCLRRLVCGVVGPLVRKVVGVKVAPGFVAAAKFVLGIITTKVFICTNVYNNQGSLTVIN